MVSAAASAVLGALTGGGVARMSAPPTVWVAVTDRRLLMFESEPTSRGQMPKRLVFDTPLDSVSLVPSGNRIELVDGATGHVIATLVFGLRRWARAALLRAAGVPTA